MIERWYEYNLPQLPSNMCSNEMDASTISVGLDDVQFVFGAVLAGGLALAAVALCAEIGFHNCVNRTHKTTRKLFLKTQ
jgi:hypothetical protein